MTCPDVIVVGAGLAGMTCALALSEAQRSVLVLEASDRPGGRVRTDTVDGFQIDRGFQTVLTSYPQVQRTLDLEALRPGAFRAGAMVRYRGGFHRLGDPRRHLGDAIPTVFNPVGTFADRLRMLRLQRHLDRLLFHQGRVTSRSALESAGFSRGMIEGFLRPFLAGVFLDAELETPARQLQFVWSMFSHGEAVLPAEGMEAIPRQLAARLPEGALRCGAEAVAVEAWPASGEGATERESRVAVTLSNGERIEAGDVVVAIESPAAYRLLADVANDEEGKARLREAAERPWRSTVALSFDAPASPVDGPWLVLNGEGPGDGPINNLCVPSEVVSGYSPVGRALVSVSVVGEPFVGDDQQLEAAVRTQLGRWYGEQDVAAWRTLRIDRVRQALPVVGHGVEAAARMYGLPPRVDVAGDWATMGPSIESAMNSGRQAAWRIVAPPSGHGGIAR